MAKVPGESRIPLFKKHPPAPTLMCSKTAKIPGVEVQPTKLAKTRTRFSKENNSAQHASSDQSAAKRTRYTSAAGASKVSTLRAPKEVKHQSKEIQLPRALSNENLIISKASNAPIKDVHKSSETLGPLKRPHFTRAVSNEEAQPQVPAPSRHRVPQTKLKENLAHAVSNETLRGPTLRYLHQPSSKVVHGSSETLNALKRHHLTSVVSTEEPGSGHSSTVATLPNGTFDIDPSLDDHMPPYINDIPSQISPQGSCAFSHSSHTNVNGLLDEKLSPATTILNCSGKSEAPPKTPPKQGFFTQLIGTANKSVLAFSPHPSQLPSPISPLLTQTQANYASSLPQTDANKSTACYNNLTPLISKNINGNFNSRFPDEVPLVTHIENTVLSAKNSTPAPHFTTDSQRPNLLSLHSACFSDQQQMSTAGMLATKWSSERETLVTCEKDKFDVNFNHIGQKVVVSGKKVGVLQYFGGIEFESGNWCGIELDEPAGLNDGTIKGVRYFTCKPNHGILAPQTKVQLYRPIKPKQHFFDMLPVLSEPSPPLLLSTKNNCMGTDSFELNQPKPTASPSAAANSIQGCDTNAGSSKPAQQIKPITKQNSFKYDESLGILTPDQMSDALVSLSTSVDSLMFKNQTANSNQVWDANAGSPKPAQQVNISKQNSFELDESLGILTPDHLPDQLVSLSASVDNFMFKNETFPESVPPILKDSIETDVLCESDGSEDLLSRAVLSKSDHKNIDVSDRTLSPEDLPMDPPAPPGSEEVKEVRSPGPSSRSQPPLTSFITSITSIGSLDTDGYQGDGELSRPASRNNCTSPTGPLPHKACVLKMKTSAQDPMTDSDFFTESDADDLAGSGKGGDRHAQVIDGTLYNNATNGGCLNQQHQRCPSFTASINEEMESSGVYSDLERKPDEKNIEEKPGNIVFSPDISTNTDSTKSEPSQVKEPMVISSETPNRPENDVDVTLTEMNARNTQITVELEADLMEVVQVNETKEFEGTPSIISNTSSQGLNDSKSSKKGIELKKYKMPKRNVVSKIKAMIEASPTNRGGNASTEEENLETSGRGSMPKAARKGRWDAVMSKIAQGQADEKMKPARLKEVKSKVFADNPPSTIASAKRKLPGQTASSAKKENQTPLKTKSRRGRTRASSSSSLPPGGPPTQPDSGAGASPNSSQRSSLSDLAVTPTPKPLRPSKKVLPARSTSPSPASELSTHSGLLRGHPTPPHVVARAASDMKTPPARKPASRRGEKHKILRDHNRLAACVPPKQLPTVEPPPAPHVTTTAESAELRHAAKSVQALAIMVQYLVHEVDAFAAPHLKERLSKMTAAWRTAAQERDELVAGNTRLKEDICSVQLQLEQLRRQHQDEIKNVVQNCEEALSQRATAHTTQLEAALEEHRLACEQLRADHEQLLVTNRATLQQEHQAEIKQLETEFGEKLARLQARYDALESDNLKGKNQYRSMLESMKLDKDTRLQTTASQCKELQDEVDSLRTVLGIRREELQDMRVKNAILEREQEEHQAEINRNSALQARIEDLEAQLEVKADQERRLSIANHRLSESFQHESFNAKRLSQYNEELKWKLKTQSEICNQLAAGKESDIDISIKTLVASCNTPIDFCEDDRGERLLCKPGEDSSPLHKTSYLERSDSVAWTFDMVDTGKKVMRTGGTVRRIKSFHDNSAGFRDFSTSPRHNKTLPVPDKRSKDDSNFWPVAASSPVRTDNTKMGQNNDSVNSIEIDQIEQLVGLETMLGEKGSCSNLAVQVAAVPKEAAGEAMISEETSEEEDSSEQHSTDEESSSEVMLS